MIFWDDNKESSETTAVVRFDGVPNNPDKREERGYFETFKGFIKKLGKGKIGFGIGPEGMNFEVEAELLDEENPQRTDAETRRALAEAEKFGAEAAEIQLRLDGQERGRAMEINGELRQIFSDQNIPEDIKIIQLLNLMDADPRFAAQVQKVRDKLSLLEVINGVKVFLPLIAGDKAEVTEEEE